MRVRLRAAAVVLSALITAGFALASEPTERSRVVIRGTGRDIVVAGAAARRGALEGGPLSRNAVAEAIRRKERGASDAEVLAYLRAHRTGIPRVIASGELARLASAGAGKSVIGYVAGVAAVDVGASGGGAPNVASNAVGSAEAPFEGDMEGAYAPYGAPYPGGYFAPYGEPGRGFFHRRSPRRTRPLSRAPIPRRRESPRPIAPPHRFR